MFNLLRLFAILSVIISCNFVIAVDVAMNIYRAENYEQMSELVFPQISHNSSDELKKVAVIKTWELYSTELSALPAFQTSDISTLLMASSTAIDISPSELAECWKNVLELTHTYNELQRFVLAELSPDTDEAIKSEIAKKAWQIFTAPLIPNVFDNIDEINRIIFERNSAEIQPQAAHQNRRIPHPRRRLHLARRIVHVSSIGMNLLVNMAQTVRHARYTRNLNSIRRISGLVQTFLPSASNLIPVASAFIERRAHLIPPAQNVATVLTILDVTITLLTDYF